MSARPPGRVPRHRRVTRSTSTWRSASAVLALAAVVIVLALGTVDRWAGDQTSGEVAPGAAPPTPATPLPPARTRPPPRQSVVAGVHVQAEKRPAPPSLRARAEKQARKQPRTPVEKSVTAAFTVGTLNVLGSNHTPPGSGWAPGRTRIAWAADVIRARGIEVIGLQEVQDDQIPVLTSRLGGYSVWPQHALGRSGHRLQVAFRSDLFELAGTGSITTRFSTQVRPVPYVLLRHLASGLTFHVVTLHNSPRDLEGERDSATSTEIALFHRLLSTGVPLLVTGDTNEPAEFFCRVGAATGMVAANGGSTSGRCVLPPRPTGLDWIMGGGITGFSGYVRTALPRITDHPIVYTDVALRGTVRQ